MPVYRSVASAIAMAVVAMVEIAGAISAPTGLMVNFQRSPSLGVTAKPQFTWVVPPCPGASNQNQLAFAIAVTEEVGGKAVWNSGKVTSPNSIGVVYTGPALKAGIAFTWTVSTWSGNCQSTASDPATFITALFHGWDASASFIWTAAAATAANTPASTGTGGVIVMPKLPPRPAGIFGFFRKVVAIPAGKTVSRATAYVTAITDDVILCGYKLFINGALANVGPGRGEAPIWGADGAFGMIYTTLDVTADVTSSLNSSTAGGKFLVAAQSVGCDACKSSMTKGFLLQLNLQFADGSTAIVATDDSWDAWNPERFVNPSPGKNWYKHMLEGIDARNEPVGWRDTIDPAAPAGFGKAVVLAAANSKKGLNPKMARPMLVVDVPAPPVNSFEQNGSTWYLIDFGRELQGGLRFHTDAGVAGTRVMITAGESRVFSNPKNKTDKGPVTDVVGDDWGYDFVWTLRDGEQMLEQHQYMEFRYVNVHFPNGTAPKSFSVSAWQAMYEWDEADSSFSCSNATLMKVWALNKYTVKAGLLDTFTDSNTRERKPYEADGLVASTSRLWLQRDPMWSRHSASYVIEHPTWPVEWVQISVLLAYADYWTTGQADLAGAYLDLLGNNTRLMDADRTGLLNCSAQVRNGCAARPGAGHHIIDWFPAPSGRMFTQSEHTSVNNAFALRGLLGLAELAKVLGRGADAAKYQAEAQKLNASMSALMWSTNGTGQFCDGICTDVGGHSGVTTATWTLFNDLVPEASIPGVWKTAADWGAEGFGDYGVFVYLSALNKHSGDDGTTMLNALTKCDVQSWCHEIEAFNATMTRESWVAGTYSHPWGTGAITGVSGGLMGIMQTSPTFATFTVKPRLGSMSHAAIKVPTLRGHIEAGVNATHTVVSVPCNTAASLCVRHEVGVEAAYGLTLLLDGAAVATPTVEPYHLCAENVGCGAGGKARVVTLA